MFLDRDGVIARDVHYCRRVEDFEILPAVPEAIKLLNEHGFRVVVITNQSGIARGLFTEATLHQIHRHMEEELAGQGARLDAIYYCPHHPDDGCQCRKPRPGLLIKAAQELGVDLAKSFMVGDSEIDIQTGKAVGSQTVLITSGPDKELVDPPDYVAGSLLQAVKWIIDQA